MLIKLVYRHLYSLCLGLTLITVGLLTFFPITSDDLFMYLALGRIFFQTGSFPLTDPFLFPDLGSWSIMHEWGSYLVFSAIYFLGSWTGLVVFKSVVILATTAVLICFAKRLRYQSLFVPIVFLIAAVSAAPRFIERSELFSNLFACLVLVILLLYRHRPGRFVYVLPAIFLFWVNLHPGFPVGLVFLGIFVAIDFITGQGWKKMRLILVSALSLGACLVNPLGISVFYSPYLHALNQSSAVFRQHFYEWMPTLSLPYRGSLSVVCFLALVFGAAGLLFLVRRKKPWLELLLYIFVSALGLSTIRYTPIASFSLAVIIIWLLRGQDLFRYRSFQAKSSQFGPVLSFGLIAVNILAGFSLIYFGYSTYSGPRKVGAGLNFTAYPFGAAEFIDRNTLTTPIFNQHEFGSFLSWYWAGERKIFYHGFVNDLAFYQSDYLGVNQSPEEFRRIVAKYRLGAFLLANYNIDPRFPPMLYRILLTDKDWKLVYQDRLSLLFVKDIPENRDFLKNSKNPRD